MSPPPKSPQHYFNNAQKIVKAAEANYSLIEAKQKRVCLDCKYYKPSLLYHLCTHPVVELSGLMRNDDYESRYVKNIKYQRGDNDVWGPIACGPPGVLYEPRPSLTKRLVNWLTSSDEIEEDPTNARSG